MNNRQVISMAAKALHVKCRNTYYPAEASVPRFHVPDTKVPWSVPFGSYNPINYTSPSVLKASWADKCNRLPLSQINFNQLDGNVDRRSYEGIYKLDSSGRPLNPHGRTGVVGRGRLGRWGPNHAADPIVTRWKVDDNGAKIIETQSGKPVLQFVAIKRKDSGEWALPGGMVDPGEEVFSALKREFSEEAMGLMDASNGEREKLLCEVNDAFNEGHEIYRGYVDDPRNTDNAWMETVAVNFHDDSGTGLALLKLSAGDDAAAVRWVDADPYQDLYASHRNFLELTAKLHDAFWVVREDVV
ncbi:ADP-ribose pyrophosphatase mitochondrial [Taenia crassiceps]|uniref:ADP-ribose pyrophosphatase mitochondrial n=1 Tax=Taenia crassiceps TaxID=6207 RepID=A0ABR4Q1D0_9CEST